MKTSAILLVALSAVPAYAQQSGSDDLCRTDGYVIGFFNGVWNTKAQAEVGLTAIRDSLVGTQYKDEKVDYELFYNQTGSGRPGVTMLEDLAETFEQRAVELDGALANRWEIFWEALGSSSDEGSFLERLATRIGRASEELKNLLGALYTDIATKSVAGWSYLLSNPPTNEDYATQHTRIKALCLEKKKMVLIAHSQGNLFVNQAYDAALTVASPESVKVVHVAPASPTVRGEHLLANIDLVINGLRVQGISTVPRINVSLPVHHLITDDFSGHKLIETYLNPKRETLPRLRGLVRSALDALVPPTTQGNVGFFTVTLTWDGPGDVDLHTFEPSGSHVYYGARQGVSGFLDVDNTWAEGPEHYFASCDASQLSPGTFRIGINNYARATGRTATVQVATTKDGEIFSSSLNVGTERGSLGDSSPIPVVDVVVTQDAQGRFQARVQ